MSFRMKRPPFKAFGDVDWKAKDRSMDFQKRGDAWKRAMFGRIEQLPPILQSFLGDDYRGTQSRVSEIEWQKSMETDPVTGAYINQPPSPIGFKANRRSKIYGKRRKRK